MLARTAWLGGAHCVARLGDRACVLRRGPSGKRPRPSDADWPHAAAAAYATAAGRPALSPLSWRGWRKTSRRPIQMRAKGAGRVIELLLSDDALSPARAAKAARLSDRAARRLFDRLIELGAARELSGRPIFVSTVCEA